VGMSVQGAAAALEQAGFTVAEAGIGSHVTGTSPSGEAPKGSQVIIEVSIFP
jgi:PASTA domain